MLKFRKIKSYLFLLIIICAIMMVIIKAYCATTLTQKSITFNDKIYNIYTDCIKFHVKANGYDKKIKEEMPNNFYEYVAPGPGRDLQTGNAKMQGYGNYVFKVETSLYNFIQYCYALNPGTTNDCCVYTGSNEANSCNYTKLCTFSGQALTTNAKTFVDNFWTKMTGTIGELFNKYQDLYFFEKYTNKGACLVFSDPNKYSEEKGKEFLTAMTSYIFTTNQNSAPNCEIKKGDIVPFLYVKEHTDDPDIKNSPKEIAKYAYLACINGWSEAASNDLWYEEYEAVFGNYDEEKLCEDIGESLEELEVWYTETFENYQEQRGNSGNALLGATIDTIIKSDYSITQQLEATEYYLQNIEGIGDYKENMARNELMAKYMMENSHIGDLIKDYNVGIEFVTENLQYGTQKDKNTKTCILSDFQVLEFDHTLDKDGQSDDDGISDLTELTTNIKWVNITGPMQKYYYDMLGNGKTTKSFDEVIDDLCKKQGKYTDSGGNIVWGHLKYEGGKVYYKTREYSSNPMLNDTDFDGMQDNIDSNKIDGKFKGSANNIGQVEYTSDFRYFFIDNNKYNDELSTMSLMMCNLVDGGTAPLHSGSQSISQYLSNLGFNTPLHKTTFKISDTENISGDLYLAKKTIQVGANKKTIKGYKDVYGVFLGGFDTELNYKKFVSNFKEEEVKAYYENIVNDVVSYINANKPSTTNEYCYWITGYSIAGGIAAEVAESLKDDGEVYCYTFGATNANSDGSNASPEIKNVINEDDLYPKIYNKDDGFYRSGYLYNDSIFDNLQREYKKLTGSKYYSDTKEYKDAVSPKLTNTMAKYIKDVKRDITIENWINEWTNDLASYLYRPHLLLLKIVEFPHFIQLGISNKLTEVLNNSTDKVKKAHDKKSYYVLSKSLNSFDLNNEDEGWTEFIEFEGSEEENEDLTDEDEEYQERLNTLLECIEEVGKAYLDNVYTYHGADKQAYNGEDAIENKLSKSNSDEYDVIDSIFDEKKKLLRSTTNAYGKWNERKEEVYEKIYEQVKKNVVTSDSELTDEKERQIADLSKQTMKTLLTQMKTVKNKNTTPNPTAIHHLDLFDVYDGFGNDLTIYNFDNTIELGRANTKTFVGDDCSCFAAAVYLYYLNKVDGKNKEKVDLWTTGSGDFIKKSNNNPDKILNILTDVKNGFAVYQWDDTEKIDRDYNIKLRTDFVLQPGDLLYRKNQNGKNTHVEFYLGEGKSFGWGEIQTSFDDNVNAKHFEIIKNLDIYNIGKTRIANQVSSGEEYRIEGNGGAGIYNTVKAYDANCRYDYVIRLEKKTAVSEEVD